MAGGLPLETWTLLSLATVVGACLQGAVGFGLGFTVVPLLAVVEPLAIPTVPLLVSVPLLVATVARDVRATDGFGSGLLALGRLPGTAVGAALLLLLDPSQLGVMVGAALLITVGIGSLRTAPALSVPNRLAAGVASGVMGTAAGVGGPPVSFVYRGQPGPVLRSTVALALLAGVLMSISAVAITGRWEVGHAWLALSLLPAALLGFVVSSPVNRRLDQHSLQRAVLALGAVAAVFSIAHSLLE